MSRVDIPVVVPWMRECAVHIIRTAYEVQGRPEIVAGMIEAEATELAKVIADYAPKRRTITDRRLEEAENEILDLRTRIRQLEPVEYPSSPQVTQKMLNERAQLRLEQINRVMPCIGPLLDAWEGTPNDFKSDLLDQYPSLHNNLTAVYSAMVGPEVKPRTGEGS